MDNLIDVFVLVGLVTGAVSVGFCVWLLLGPVLERMRGYRAVDKEGAVCEVVSHGSPDFVGQGKVSTFYSDSSGGHWPQSPGQAVLKGDGAVLSHN